MAVAKRARAVPRVGRALSAHTALLARYASLNPERLPDGIEFFILETGKEELFMVCLDEKPPSQDLTVLQAKLSAAEQDVLHYLLRGHSNVAIARARKRSARTVAHQIASIFRKLEVYSRRELLALARI